MFELDWGKLVVIGIVALIVIGPKELPTVLRTVGQWVTKIRRMASEFQGQFQEAMREAEMADLKKQVESVGDLSHDFSSTASTSSPEPEAAQSEAGHESTEPSTTGESGAPEIGAEPLAASSVETEPQASPEPQAFPGPEDHPEPRVVPEQRAAGSVEPAASPQSVTGSDGAGGRAA